jgi:hypothetical protein
MEPARIVRGLKKLAAPLAELEREFASEVMKVKAFLPKVFNRGERPASKS